MSASAPAWLEDFQARLGAVLRTPLDRSTGTLRAALSTYDPRACREVEDGPRATAAERLAVYNRQYWFRLFEVLQHAFPLTTHLIGPWAFNDYAAEFLIAHPPQHWDVDRVADGLCDFLAKALSDATEHRAWREAARIDAGWRAILQAPIGRPFRPVAQDAPRLLDWRLIPAPTVVLYEEHWPLTARRHHVLAAPSEAAGELPPRLPRAQWWAIARVPQGIEELALEPRQAQLMLLLRQHTVRQALARLEAACSEAERAELPEKAQAWLARSVRLGFWSGTEEGSTAPHQ